MAKLIEITGKVLSGEWGTDDESGNGIPVLRTTNFTNEGIVDYSNVVTRTIQKKNIDAKYLRKGDIIIEKSGGSDKQPVGRVIYFDGPESTYLFNNFTGLLRVKNQAVWLPRYALKTCTFSLILWRIAMGKTIPPGTLIAPCWSSPPKPLQCSLTKKRTLILLPLWQKTPH